MEDYSGAHKSRLKDIEVLLASASVRSVAAAHLGGIAVECQLKSLVLIYHQLLSWGSKSARKKDPLYNQEIARPGHGLVGSLRLIKKLYDKALTDRLFLRHLAVINHPRGPTLSDFIDLRYSSVELSANAVADWKKSFDYVIGWLEKNGDGL